LQKEAGMTDDPTIVTKLAELLTAIKGFEDPRRAMAEWKQVHKLLQKTDVPAIRATNIVAGRDLARLTELVGQLQAPAEAAPVDVPDLETCRQAFRAFRKRLALTRLDDESRISNHSPLSKGEGSRIGAIMPPIEWPHSVWQELARQGRLIDVGHGFYELPKQQPPEFS
jgi:hypothetical protein